MPITATKDGKVYSVVINNGSQYDFNSNSERVMFINGYNRGMEQRESLSHTKPYSLGFQVGSNERARMPKSVKAPRWLL